MPALGEFKTASAGRTCGPISKLSAARAETDASFAVVQIFCTRQVFLSMLGMSIYKFYGQLHIGILELGDAEATITCLHTQS